MTTAVPDRCQTEENMAPLITHLSEDPIRNAEVALTEERDKNLGVKRL
jgi:hypothetical protein